MAARELNEEASALWAAVFGDAPRPTEDPRELLRCVVESMPRLEYDRFVGRRREPNLVFPKGGDHPS